MNLSHELNILTFLKAAPQKSCNRQNKMSCGNENLFRREPAYWMPLPAGAMVHRLHEPDETHDRYREAFV